MREMGRENGVNAYGYSGGEGLGIKDMVGGVLGRFGVKCLEEGLCKIELTHRACGLLGGGSRCDYLGQWVKVCQLGTATVDMTASAAGKVIYLLGNRI
jgi:hypothetical protein